MKKTYKITILFIDNKEKIEIVSAENELLAIDQIMEKYNKKKEILDIKIV